jgi:hypothetical protein
MLNHMMLNYSQNRVDTLRMKNLLHLREDCYFTMLLLKYFLMNKMQFIRDAHVFTVTPDYLNDLRAPSGLLICSPSASSHLNDHPSSVSPRSALLHAVLFVMIVFFLPAVMVQSLLTSLISHLAPPVQPRMLRLPLPPPIPYGDVHFVSKPIFLPPLSGSIEPSSLTRPGPPKTLLTRAMAVNGL